MEWGLGLGFGFGFACGDDGGGGVGHTEPNRCGRSVRARSALPISVPHMDLIWELPDGPGIWARFEELGWVANFCLDSDRTCRLVVWDGNGDFSCRCSKVVLP